MPDQMCDMCLEKKETTHFALYVSGSEGTHLCHDCEMWVVRFIREQARAVVRRRRADHIMAAKIKMEAI